MVCPSRNKIVHSLIATKQAGYKLLRIVIFWELFCPPVVHQFPIGTFDIFRF